MADMDNLQKRLENALETLNILDVEIGSKIPYVSGSQVEKYMVISIAEEYTEQLVELFEEMVEAELMADKYMISPATDEEMELLDSAKNQCDIFEED